MRVARIIPSACALALALGAARAADPIALTLPDADVADILSGVDFIPGKPALEGVLDDPNPDLIALATDTEMDPGLRLRAVRALALYPGDATRAVLLSLLADNGSIPAGIETLLVRAAMYALATIDGAAAVGPLAPLLDHPSRDVVADAAHALALTGSPAASPFLGQRKAAEELLALPSQQIIWALNEAIRALAEQ
ncbi:MAG TPA: HEAT repeat domain-containing protein [Kofleriaceae bacterium]|nr:HEAT repeat domain-containing protein [Kofleriaceae bacterium]